MVYLVKYSDPFWDSDFDFAPKRIQRFRHRPYICRRPSLSSVLECALSPLSELDSLVSKELGSKSISSSLCGKDGFKVSMDVKSFKPEELKVKVVDKHVVVEGKHEEREDDHGYISRHFVRRYALPDNYDPEKVCSTLSSDGVLTVSVPKPEAIEDKSKERVIEIQQTSEALMNGNHSPEDESKVEKSKPKK